MHACLFVVLICVSDILCFVVLQCTVPILVKCGGNYKQYFPSW
jgi:hypothetical protein